MEQKMGALARMIGVMEEVLVLAKLGEERELEELAERKAFDFQEVEAVSYQSVAVDLSWRLTIPGGLYSLLFFSNLLSRERRQR
jgi:hypothetical protein